MTLPQEQRSSIFVKFGVMYVCGVRGIVWGKIDADETVITTSNMM